MRMRSSDGVAGSTSRGVNRPRPLTTLWRRLLLRAGVTAAWAAQVGDISSAATGRTGIPAGGAEAGVAEAGTIGLPWVRRRAFAAISSWTCIYVKAQVRAFARSARTLLLVHGMAAYTGSGVIGGPSAGTAAKGRAILDSLTGAFRANLDALTAEGDGRLRRPERSPPGRSGRRGRRPAPRRGRVSPGSAGPAGSTGGPRSWPPR
jgi:hypothetical protein